MSRRGLVFCLTAVWTTAVGEPGRDFQFPEDAVPYASERGYGVDSDTPPAPGEPFTFSVRVPEGNWRVRVRLGDSTRESNTTVKAESRRLMAHAIATDAGEFTETEFIVNVRTAALEPPPTNAPGGTAVRLNPREQGVRHWDDQLTLEFCGPAPRVAAIRIEPAPDVPTLFLAGDSTVTDQPHEPAASWGQMLPWLLGPRLAVANHAESGETLKSFLTSLRLDKLLSMVRPGDYVLIQFGHNDSKAQWPQTYAAAGSTYDAYLRAYVAEVRRRQATPVLLTSVHRRVFDEHGRIRNTHGDYPDAVKAVAAAERVPCIDLAAMSGAFYEALGPERAPLAFADEGRDVTHHNAYGAYVLARCVAAGLVAVVPELADRVPEKYRSYHPGNPDLPEAVSVAPSPAPRPALPRGN